MTDENIIRIEVQDAGRLDSICAAGTELTRSRLAGLIKYGQISVNGSARTKPGFKVNPGDVLEIHVPEPVPVKAQPQDLDIDVIYQDEDLAVVYKPSGMVVHPAAGNPDGTLVNALLAKLDCLSGIGGELRPGIVHRIDKDTSGLLLVAKNDFAHNALSEQIKQHSISRAYLAIAQGHFKVPEGEVEAAIGRHPVDRKRMSLRPDGKYALTHYRVLEELKGASYVECILTTGRTHQIRVHLSSIGHPLLGDPVYGPKKMPYPVKGGQLLHAYLLGFVHPRSGKELRFEAQPEPRFIQWLEKLR